MNKEKKQLIEEIHRFNEINNYSTGVIVEQDYPPEAGEPPEEGASWIPALVAGGVGYWVGKNGLPFAGKILGAGTKAATAVAPAAVATATKVAPAAAASTGGVWTKGLTGIKGLSTVTKLSGVGVAAAVVSMTSADPTVVGVSNMVAGASTGAALGSFVGPYGTAIGAIIGGAAGAIMSQWSEDVETLIGGEEAWTLSMTNTTWEAFNDMKVKDGDEGEIGSGIEIISSSEAETISAKLLGAMKGMGTNENAITDAIDMTPSLVDLSRVHDRFGTESSYGFSGTLVPWIEDELTSGELNRLKNQLKNKPLLIYDGKEINTMAEWEEVVKENTVPTEEEEAVAKFSELWKNYPCVISTLENNEYDAKWSSDNKQVTIKIGEAMARFSNTGKFTYKGPSSDNKVTPVGKYVCIGDDLSFGEEADGGMNIEESYLKSGKLSGILKQRNKKRILEQSQLEFGDMLLTIPDQGSDEEAQVSPSTPGLSSALWLIGPSLAMVVQGRGVIKKYHKGDGVTAVQSIVGAPVDGKYGDVTQKAVIAYQGQNGLKQTGIVDQPTAQLMTASTVSPQVATETIVTTTDENEVNQVAFDMEQTTTDVVIDQIEQLNVAIAKQPTKKKCIELIGTAAAGCKMGVKNINRNSLAQCYNSYNFGINKVGRNGKSRRTKKCYDLKGRGNTETSSRKD